VAGGFGGRRHVIRRTESFEPHEWVADGFVIKHQTRKRGEAGKRNKAAVDEKAPASSNPDFPSFSRHLTHFLARNENNLIFF